MFGTLIGIIDLEFGDIKDNEILFYIFSVLFSVGITCSVVAYEVVSSYDKAVRNCGDGYTYIKSIESCILNDAIKDVDIQK